MIERNGQRGSPKRGEGQGWDQPSSTTALPWEENLGYVFVLSLSEARVLSPGINEDAPRKGGQVHEFGQ